MRGVCWVFVVLFGVCMLFVSFLLRDCWLQCIVCGLLSGAAVMSVVCCKLCAVCCDYCFLRLLFAGCCLLCVIVSGLLLVVFKCVLVIVCCLLLAD